MNELRSVTADRAISCALVVGVFCVTLLILAVILIGTAEP